MKGLKRDDEELLKAYLLGAVLGSVLCQRGYFLLHASVMDTEKGGGGFLRPFRIRKINSGGSF